MRKQSLAFILLLCILSLSVCSWAAKKTNSPIVLAKAGKPTSTIVIAKNATKSAQFAACELQYHIEKITGAKLHIVTDDVKVVGTKILVGDSKATADMGLRGAKFKPQEFLIGFRPNTLILIGRDKDDRAIVDYANGANFPGAFEDQGTCYATYDFLERFCGVRWYLPTEIGLVYPETKTLKLVGKDIRRSPGIRYRWVTPIPGTADLCGDTIAKDVPMLSDRENQLWNRRYRMGGEPYEANHSLEGYYGRFLATHPDWFAQGYTGTPPQLCYTNPEVVAQVVQDAREYFDGKGAKPGAVAIGDYFSIVPMDGTPPWCKCPNCVEALKDGDSNYIYSFINKVAREIKKSHPDKFIATLAYSSYMDVPKKVKLESNITVMLCLNVRSGATDPDIHNAVTKRLTDWMGESKQRPKFLWLYYCWPSMSASILQWRCFPGFYAHQLVKDMNIFRDSGMRGIFIEPSYLPNTKNYLYGYKSFIFDQLEWYLTWRMADDPSLDGNKLIDEFFSSYYGSAAVAMKNVYNKIESIYCGKENYPAGPFQMQTEEIAWKYLGTEKHMNEIGKMMEKAKLAASTEIEKQRVALFDKGVWQYMQAGRAVYLKNEALALTTIQQVSVPKTLRANGDTSLVEWSKAAVISKWYTNKGDSATKTLDARIAHDGEYLYMRLEELVNPQTLDKIKNNVWEDDNWELFFAKQKSLPYHHMGINSLGTTLGFTDDAALTPWVNRARIVSDTNSGDKWVVLISIPLSNLVPGGAQAGDVVYGNIFRGAAGQQIDKSGAWIPTFEGYGIPSRFGEITLEK